jgi:lipid-binding SYLF domain-containing protein
MSLTKLGMALFSGFLIFATAHLAAAQQKSTSASRERSIVEKKEADKSLGLSQAEPQTSIVPQPNVSDLERVRQIQRALADLGYGPDDETGMMSSDTHEAIRQFQWWNNLPVTGLLDERTVGEIEKQDRVGVANTRLNRTPVESQERQKPGIAIGGPITTTPNNIGYNPTKIPKRHYSQKKGEQHQIEANKTAYEASQRVTRAANILQDLTSMSDRPIPDEILQRADAIAVIPHMVKGALGIGGRYGKGVVSARAENGLWSAPAFIQIGGGSAGVQLGVETTDLVLIFTNPKSMELLETGNDLRLGANAGVAAGPISRDAEPGANANVKAEIYAYSRSKGLFAGVALDGLVLSMDTKMNQQVYGASADAKHTLNGNVEPNSTVLPFMAALERAVAGKRISRK